MTQQFIITGNIEFAGEGILEGRVEAFDRDLPSLEQRGSTPQLLGQSPIDDNFRFRIEFTDEQFRRGESETSFLRRAAKISPDLSFRVFDASGRELTIARVVAQNREYRPGQIIFNAPPNLEGVEIAVEPAPETGDSEYERLVAAIAPVIQDIPLTGLTEDDVIFLINELGFEQQLDIQQQIQWLRRSALLASQTDLLIEAFYGWGRVNIPSDFAELVVTPLTELQPLLKQLLAETDDRLRGGLRTAISDKIIPDLGDRIDEILAQIERIRVGQGLLTARRFIGKLLNERSGETLVGLSVQGFDLDAGQEPKNLGQNVSNNEGVFTLNYIIPPPPAGAEPNQTRRRLRLQVLLNPQTQEKFETEVQAGGDQDILDIPVPIPAPPEPESHQLSNLAPTLPIELPLELLPFLADKNINTLADIRKAGGISRLEGLPVAADHPAVQLLEAHVDLSRISPDVQVNAVMIQNRYDSVTAIAKASRPDFVGTIRDRLGDFKAAQMQVSARAQTNFLDNFMFKKLADHVNGVEVDPLVAEQIRCRCRDCEAAVSPLAYFADLLKYATENIKNSNVPITAANLADIFHQPFDLPASCEAADAQIRQVRLCVEVLRRFLGARPLADAATETKLANAEKDYRLAAYATLLTKIGTNYAELRLSRTGEPSLRQSLTDRLGIELSHLNALFLDPNAVPDTLTEAALEQLFGLVDTNRDPFTPAATAELQTWRLEYLPTLWKAQDFPTDGYEDGQNAIALKQLPAGVAFAPPLDTKISYDTDRQQLACQGEMTIAERSTLLALDPDLPYQQAIKQLFQTSQRLTIIDPDLIGPDDFRRPFLKANPGDSDRAFDLWKKRRNWVDDRLQIFSGLTKVVPGQPQPVPNIAAMFAAMYQPVTYGAISVTAWANTTPSTEFETLRNQLTQGIDVNAIKFRLQDDLNLPVENFTRLMAIAAKAKAWESDTRNDTVKDDEWREVYSILVQAQKVKLFAAWRKEESDAGIQFDSQTFWLSLRQPQEGEWPPILSTKLPLIDPATLKLKDLPEPIAGERAIAFWQARQTRLEQIAKDLDTARQTNGFDAMLKLALGHPNPGDPLQHDLTTLKTDLSNPDPAVVASATTKITNDLHLTVENFKRLLAIKAKNDDPDPAKKPTAADWVELSAILTPARKIKHAFPLWINQEQNPLTGVVYWNALKAKLPRWRSAGDARQLWQQALRDRSQSAIIDPDLIGPGDLKNPAPGDPAFDLWKARDGEINTQLTQLAAAPQTLAGLDTNFQSILGVSVAQFLKIAEDQQKGNVISDRLAQLSLEVAEFNYLLRVSRLVNQNQPILDLEWENTYSILVQVWKRRQSAQWRAAEKAQTILLSSDFFQIPPPAPIQFPPKEPTIVDIWRSPRLAYLDWQDKLQSRLDQENTTIQAIAEAVSAAEEVTLPLLRDALVLAISPAGVVVTTPPGELEVKAKWITINLLIDAKMSGCSMTTRVAQAIETLQGLILALRTGQLADLYKTFTLNLDNFNEKWKWLGSYAPWRAAMFVFLYPENILQPSLRKPEWQTPAFKALIKNTGTTRKLTPADACQEAQNYSEYFEDICTLQIEASCTSRTRLTKGDECSKTDGGYRCLFYMFGRGGLTGELYWSAYDFQGGSGYGQKIWIPIKAADGTELKDLEKIEEIEEIVGAVPYQTSLNERFIFLLARKRDASNSNRTIVCAKYDLEKPGWQSESIAPLDVSAQTLSGFAAVVKQQDFENSPPHIVISNGLRVFEIKISANGEGWENQTPYPLGGGVSNVLGVVGIDRNSFYTINQFNDGLQCTLYIPANDPRSNSIDSTVTAKFEGSRYRRAAGHNFFEIISLVPTTIKKTVGGYLGSFSWPERDFIYVVTEETPRSDSRFGVLLSSKAKVWKVGDSGSQELEVTEVHSPFGDSAAYLIPTSGLIEDTTAKTKRLVYQTYNNITTIINNTPPPIVDRFFVDGDGGLYSRQPYPVRPSVPGLFNIPNQLSTQDLQLRKGMLQKSFEKNRVLLSNLIYLDEAYYFVPVHLALALQRSGEYLAALNWLRTIYDYTSDVSKRKIYYGLVVEESLADTYARGKEWLLDPLNPHAIAATRQNTYTRFTLLAIIRCLLDYADAEFTQDTAESNPRARRLYLTALELLEANELKQSLNQCEEIIGILDNIPISDDRWQISFQQIKGELKAIPDPQRLQPVVNQIRQALIADTPLEQRFIDARTILNQAIAALPPAPNLTTVIQENENFSHTIQRSVLSDSSLAAALESVSTIATEDFQRTVTMVTGISPARLELRAVDLPWLREPISLAVNPEEAQPRANLAIARRDAAQLDVLALSHMATLAQIAAFDPMNAVNLAVQAQEVHIPQLIISFCIPPNPLLKTLYLRAALNLYKLRTCRNIAGLKRQLEPYSAPTDTTSDLPTVGSGRQLLLPGVARLQPTFYRYQVLIERAKQLVQLAGQIEATFLSALVQRDVETYNLLKVRQELNLAQAGVRLQSFRVMEANDGVTLAGLQKKRAEIQVENYNNLIQAGLNEYEQQMLNAYDQAEKAQIDIAFLDAQITSAQAFTTAATGGVGAPGAATVAAIVSLLANTRAISAQDNIKAQTTAQGASIRASFENRKREWEIQVALSTQDVAIGEQQITLANDQVEITTQEKVIAELKASNDKDTIEFLTTKFTSIKLYDWMSNILEKIYCFFLQQATAMAQLAENQLAFERQEVPPSYIQADYWNAPSDGATGSNPNTPAPDRKGLTGSARLLQDIYQLDQYAFNTNKRKLQLSKTFSLASLAPAEFQRFRETGVMIFSTPMEMFDRDFPGHYLRLIRRVRISVIALIPPTQGIHATLTSLGLSRTVIGPDVFQTVSIRRDPEFVALTSPANSTGMFELESLQPDMLFPFEGNGVDSTWEFRMPKAANQFDYRTIADVLITIEYTALNSFDYRQQVIQTLKPNLSGDRPFSFRNQFADQWYDLNNPEQTKTPMKVKFQTFREDFPPNVETLKIQQVLLYFVRASQKTFELPITTLRFTEQGNQGTVGGSATPIDGIISTRRGNAGSWTATIGKAPVGEWELTLPNTEEVKKHFLDEEIDDILFVITYAGRTPEWPA
jgi:Tc toxin complex TcA C-terminal TcB-binding domain